MSLPQPATAATIDWRAALMFLPQRRFSADELRRAVPGGINNTIKISLALNLGLPMAVFLAVFGPRNPPQYAIVLLLYLAGVLAGAAAAWLDPSSRAARWAHVRYRRWLIFISAPRPA